MYASREALYKRTNKKKNKKNKIFAEKVFIRYGDDNIYIHMCVIYVCMSMRACLYVHYALIIAMCVCVYICARNIRKKENAASVNEYEVKIRVSRS